MHNLITSNILLNMNIKKDGCRMFQIYIYKRSHCVRTQEKQTEALHI